MKQYVFCLLLTMIAGFAQAQMSAYYTRINSGESFEQFSRTGPYGDIVVQLTEPAGRLVFWRGTSYLPYWETSNGQFAFNEIVARQGDGDAKRPDRVNAFSRVWLVEDGPDQVTVCWRYLPQFQAGNPYGSVDRTAFTEETFVITPNGQVVRTIKGGTAKIDDWNDPLNKTVVNLSLTPSGVVEQSRTLPQHSPAPVGLSFPTKGQPVVSPVREWRFDEGAGDETVETVTGFATAIAGHKSLWRKGVSDTCLQFDGYYSTLNLPAVQAPAISDAITLEAWLAIGAYPWNWCPVVQQGDDSGYFLGVCSRGEAALKLNIGGTLQELVYAGPLPRFRWLHLAGTYDRASGKMALYLDGQKVAERTVTAAAIQTTGDPLRIGMGKSRMPTDSLGGDHPAVTYSLDGLIDEVRIYDQVLDAAAIQASFSRFSPTANEVENPPMDARPLPTFNCGGDFGAHYTRLVYHDVWDNLWRFGPYADVVVGFDQLPAKFVFWRGTGYIPMLVNENGYWYSNEFNETWGSGGCMEPMSDNQCFFNHARVIENTPARVVVQWRYPLIDVFKKIANKSETTGWGDWSDWYYTIYPDGVAVKHMRLWTAGARNHEWHESMVIMADGQRPADIVEGSSPLHYANFAGQSVDLANCKIQVLDMKGQYDPFMIGDFSGGSTWGAALGWNHWPTSQIESDGRNAPMADRASHHSYNNISIPTYGESYGDAPYQEKVILEGFSSGTAGELAPLAHSWEQAPPIEALADCGAAAYVKTERAYHLTATGGAPSVRIAASAAQPIVNLCLVVKGWPHPVNSPALLLIDNVPQPAGPDFRQGIVRDSSGNPMLVVWVGYTTNAPATFTLLSKPTTPSGLTAAPGLATVALNWDPSIGATGYKVWRRNTISNETFTETVVSPPYRVSGLDIGVLYEFKVCATNSAGDSDWSALVSATPTAVKGSQTITFKSGSTLSKIWNDPSFVDPATASSGLPVSYSSDNPAIATVDSNSGLVTLTGIGTAHLLANQAGDDAFESAPQTSQTLTVDKASQTITFKLGSSLSKGRNDPPFADMAIASSGLPVSYSSDNPAIATVNPNSGLVTLTGIGTVHILADQPGNAYYHPAPQASQTLTVNSISVATSYSASPIPFVNDGVLVGAAVFGNAGTWDGIPFAHWSAPFTTPVNLGSGVSATASASWTNTIPLGGEGPYQIIAYTSNCDAGSFTISGLDAQKVYRLQYGFCDTRPGHYPYSVNVAFALSDGSSRTVPFSIGTAGTDDDYALVTVTVTGTTSVELYLPTATNGVGPILGCLSVHTDIVVGPICLEPPLYDLNDDCVVDLSDFSALASQWLTDGYVYDGISVTTSYSASHIPFVNDGILVGAAVLGNAGTWDGIPFALWSPFSTPLNLGTGVSATVSATWCGTTSLGGINQYQVIAYTSAEQSSSLTISGLDAQKVYRFQYGFCDSRPGYYPYSVNATLTLSDSSSYTVPFSIGAAASDDNYALVTVTVTGTTSLELYLPTATSNGVGPILGCFAVHSDITVEPICMEPPLYDLNDDCIVDINDFSVLVSQWLTDGHVYDSISMATSYSASHIPFVNDGILVGGAAVEGADLPG